MREIELLSPARNLEIGIAAIDCGADSVYIAAPKYGARQQAGNSFREIEQLCSYAHKFGAKIYLTLNTILYDTELDEARDYLWEAWRSGTDAVIVQDFALLEMDRPPLPLFASTQTDIRTPEKAALLEKLGFSRLILARELSLKQIADIRKATTIPLETFVHGALCVSCSGQCYLSRHLTGRSANRGQCAQACRSLYDLVDENGNVLQRNTPLLSLKDLNLSGRIPDLIDAGATSFKIEGRLKNISYVKNIVSLYSQALNQAIAEKREKGEEMRRASWGRSRTCFVPNANKTFNRGYTEFFIDGKRGNFKSEDSARGIGEYIGKVAGVKGGGKSFASFSYIPDSGHNNHKDKIIHNSDGLCFVSGGKISSGKRANRCEGNTVELFAKATGIKPGDSIYRNFDSEFEKQMENIPPRIIDVNVEIFLEDRKLTVVAHPKLYASTLEKEQSYNFSFEICGSDALNPHSAKELIQRQIGKTALHFSFNVESISADKIYFYKTSSLNAIRNELAQKLDYCINCPDAKKTETDEEKAMSTAGEKAMSIAEEKELQLLAEKAFKEGGGSYLRNSSNSLSREIYTKLGIKDIKPSYEQVPPKGATLMRCKYCIRYQIGKCKKESKDNSQLYLKNDNNILALEFDCENCEMLVKAY